MATNAAVVVAEDFKRDQRGRRITPRARRLELVEAYRTSGLTMEQFAQREGINRLTLAKWCTLLSVAKRPARFTEVKLGMPAPAWAYEVTLPNGMTVRAANAPGLVQLLGMMPR